MPCRSSSGPALPRSRCPEGRGARPLKIDQKAGSIQAPTDRVGFYTVELRAGGRSESILYAVNFDPKEYELVRADPEKDIKPAFDADCFQVLTGSVERSGGDSGPKDIWPEIGLALLLLLVGESFFANRFYKAPSSSLPTATPAHVSFKPEEVPAKSG